jgi:hypothetical protein
LPLIFLFKSTHRLDRPVKDPGLYFNQPTLLFSDRDKINFRLGLGPVEIIGCEKFRLLLQHGKNIVDLFLFKALIPILTSTGRGSDIMVPMAIPSFGGMVIALLTVFVVPVLYCWVEEVRVKTR